MASRERVSPRGVDRDMSRVYLLRHAVHGLVDKVLAGRMAGVHLSPEGQAQAERAADHLASLPFARILSSPMERCRETAEPVARRHRLVVTVEPALNEIDCGAWTGMGFDALAEDPRWRDWNRDREGGRMPEGERAAEVRTRVMALIETLTVQDQGPTLLVTHSDVIKTVVLSLIGTSLDSYDRITVDPASLTVLDLWPGGGKVVRLNQEIGA